jgi:hypothetical protein
MAELVFNSSIDVIDGDDINLEVPDISTGGQVTVSYSEQVGFPAGIPGDRYPTFSEDGLALPANLIQSVYQGTTFSVKVSFKVLDELLSTEDVPVYVFPTSVTCTTNTAAFGIDAQSSSASSMTLSGTAVRLFDDEFYTYLTKPNETLTLSAINNTEVEDFLSVVNYQEPASKEVSVTYKFNINYTDSSNIPKTATKSIQQYIYWNYAISMASFSVEVGKGIK